MSKKTEPSEWSLLHDLGLIFLALSHGADLEIAPAEMATMARALQEWFPEAPFSRIEQTIEEVLLTYVGEHRGKMLDTSVATIKEEMSKEYRISVLNDLADLASADGKLAPEEISFIHQLARYWEVDGDILR